MTVQIENCPDPGLTIVLVIDQALNGDLVPISISSPNGLTTGLLRRLKLTDLVVDSAMEFAEIDAGSDGSRIRRTHFGDSFAGITPERAHLMRLEGPTDENLRKIALVYAAATVMRLGPTKHVADVIGLPISTAGNWVRKARDAGYLDEVAK